MPGLIPLTTGIVLTVAVLGISSALGLHRERGVWPALLIAIAAFYVVFAFEHSSASGIFWQSAIAMTFMVLALFGYKTSLWFIVAGLVLHGIFDGVSLWLGASPAPHWWGPFCVGVDFLLAAALAHWIAKGHFFKRAPSSSSIKGKLVQG